MPANREPVSGGFSRNPGGVGVLNRMKNLSATLIDIKAGEFD
jgi:hypothetical protein